MSLVDKINDIIDGMNLWKNSFITELRNKGLTMNDSASYKDIADGINNISASQKINPIKSFYEDYNAGKWTSVTTIPAEAYRMKATVVNNKIECIFGNYRLEYDGSTWKKFTDIPYACDVDMTVLTYNNELHVIGGGSGSYRKMHYKFDGVSWSKVSTIPYQFYRGTAVVYNNEIHILGGGSSTTYHYKYDGTSWTKVSTIPFSSMYGTSVVYNNELHLISNGGGSLEKYGYHYKWDGNTWSLVKRFNPINSQYDQSSFSIAVVYNNKIHLFNGYDSYHMIYDGTSWSTVGKYQYGTYSTIVVYHNKIHSIGGNKSRTTHAKLVFSDSIIPTDMSWSKISSVLDECFTCIVFKNKIEAFNNKFRMEYDGTSWTKITDIPNSYGDWRYCSVIVYNNELHIFGGGYAEDRTMHYKFDGTSWMQVSTIPFQFYEGHVVVYKDEIHLIGGRDSKSVHYKFNEYDDTLPYWIKLDDLSFSSTGGTCVVYNGEIHLITNGGDTSYNGYHYKYDGTSWTLVYTFSKSEISRIEFSNAVVYDNKIHMFNGYDEVYYIYDGTTWTYIAPYEYGVCDNGAILVYNDKIHSIGSDKYIHYEFSSVEISVSTTLIVPNTATIYHETTSPTITKINDEYNLAVFTKGEYFTVSNNNKIIHVSPNSSNKCYLPQGTKINGVEISTYGVMDYPTYPCIIE